MFDRIATPRPRRSRWVGFAIAASLIGHLGGGTALLVVSLWQIDKLTPERTGIVTVAAGGLPGPAAEPPPPAPAATEEPRTEKVATEEMTQPDPDPVVLEEIPASRNTSGQDGVAGGHADGIDGGRGTTPFGMGGGGGDGSGDAIATLQRKEPPTGGGQEPAIVPPSVIEGRLLSGNTHIEAPESVRVDMLHAGLRQLVGAFKLCIDASGRVSRLSIIDTTDYPAYDRKLVTEMQQWRYVPYEVGGEAVPVCTAITVVYRLID